MSSRIRQTSTKLTWVHHRSRMSNVFDDISRQPVPDARGPESFVLRHAEAKEHVFGHLEGIQVQDCADSSGEGWSDLITEIPLVQSRAHAHALDFRVEDHVVEARMHFREHTRALIPRGRWQLSCSAVLGHGVKMVENRVAIEHVANFSRM